jgi:hypothetical protein
MSAELRRLLDDEIHALATSKRLQQDETKGRLTLDGPMLAHLDDRFSAGEAQGGLVFAATTVEHRESGAVAKPQHFGDVLSRLVTQGDATAWLER